MVRNGDYSYFKIVAVHHLKFVKFEFLEPARSGSQSTVVHQILLELVKQILRYCDFLTFTDGGRLPSRLLKFNFFYNP